MKTARVLQWTLMTVVVLALSLSVASCKDDDDKDGGGNTEVGGQTVNDLGLTDDEMQLAVLLKQWCDVEPQDIKPGILDQTFEPAVGSANGFVRTMVMETQEAADAYAVSALSKLNINPQQPVGFSWSNAAIGSVSYQRGTGNELGVINVNVRQIPHLTAIRLVKDPEENAPNGGVPYYRKGDIVKYTGSGDLKGSYFLCLNDHNAGQPSNWITFDEVIDEPATGTCGWMFTGNDSVFNAELASTNNLATWLSEFVLNEKQWKELIMHIKATAPQALDYLVPKDDDLRLDFIRSIIRTPDQVVTDPWEPLTDGGTDIQAIKAGWPKRVTKTKSSYVVETYEPTKLLLCNSMRWSMGTTYDYWVPYLSLVKRGLRGSDALTTRLTNTKSQMALSESHFKWQAILDFHVDIPGMTADEVGDYDLFQTAIHWQHKEFKVPNDQKKHYGLLNFTVLHPAANNAFWSRRNITSYELTVTDKGEKYKYFEDVYRRQGGVDKEPYNLGDVVKDETDGSIWFCLRPSGNPYTGMSKALFVSFDGITTYDNADRSANNIVNKDEAYQVGYYLEQMILNLDSHSHTDQIQQYVINTMKNSAHVDLKKLYVKYDSIVVRKKENETQGFGFSVAYNDGTRDRQPVMRVMVDGTHCLVNERVETGKDAYYFTRYYNRYQQWNGGGKDQWEADWTMSDQRMYLDDVANQQVMNQYATDKWVELPFSGEVNRHSKRTVADANGAKVSRYLWKNGRFADDSARSMYNEPVLFFRTMWLNDKSLTADNGHKVTVVDHVPQSESTVNLCVLWFTYYTMVAETYMTVDNKFTIPFQVTQ